MREEFAFKPRKQSSDTSDSFQDEVGELVAAIPPRRKKRRERELRHVEAGRREDRRDASSTGVKFCSRSEAICAELLRRFVPHFDLQEGVTFQVPIGMDERGNTLAVDFLVDGVLFEYHPVRFFKNKKGCGDFKDRDEYKEYTRVFHALKIDKRDFFHDVMKARLTENYFKRRRALLDQHPLFRRTELIVATSPEEFYHLVIRRFGKNFPNHVEKFTQLFLHLQNTLPD